MANIIYAKFNSGSESRNVLDPNTWVGGVVPGPNDVARLWYAGINSAYEQSYLDQNQSYGQRDAAAGVQMPIMTNSLTGSLNNEITASKFMPSLLAMKAAGNYSNTSFHSLNTEENLNNYNAYYKNALSVRGYYGPVFYKEYARYLRFNTNGVACSITIEGTTYSESDTTTYDTRQKMCNRFKELLEGNIPSKYTIIGPHNGSGISNNSTGRETTYSGSYLTITFESGSDLAPTNTSTAANQWYSGASNITVGDNSAHYRTMKTLITSSNPFIVMESGSYRFNTVSIDWISGSGYWWQPSARASLGYLGGAGPGNIHHYKINFKDIVSSGFPQSCSIDTDYIVPTVKPYNDYPSDQIYLDARYIPNTYKSQSVSFYGNYNNDVYTEYALQKYHLTGSGVWEVGMIEMGDYNHFHVKDNAKIVLHDLQDGTYYPTIDFVNMGSYQSTLLVTDNVTIQVSSSRTSIVAESGLWCRASNNSLIFSGSQNYSSSISPSASSAGDGTIQISNLSDTFGVGDYVSIESTGSYRFWNPMYKNHTLEGDIFLTGSTKISMSYAEQIKLGAFYGHTAGVREQAYLVSGSVDHEGSAGIIDEWTHPIENDEVFQIVSMSGDTAIVGQRYPKEGTIHQDMGLYDRTNFIATFASASIPETYNGSKRVVLVESTHKLFDKDDLLIIDNVPCKVLHATTYLSQSKFFNFSDGSARADQIFKSAQGQHSGSSIFTQAFGSYGITTNTYWAEQYQKHTLLITGSEEGFKGSGWGLEQGTGMQAEALGSYAYNAGQYGGRSGSSNGYTALRLDPTLAYRWRNYSHAIVSTNYMYGIYLIDNLLFEDGELLVSGSLIRDGSGDPTSSQAYDPYNGFGITWEMAINQSGAEHQHSFAAYNPRTGYIYPYPYSKGVAIQGYHGNPSVYINGGTNYALEMPLGLSGSTGYSTINVGGTNTPLVNKKLFDTDFSSSLGVDVNHIIEPSETGSCHLRVDIQSELSDVYIGVKGKEKLLGTTTGGKGKGGVGVYLGKYGSIHSINIKKRYQQLILDTSDSFNAQDKILEGGLLESHPANKKVKFIATEIKDVRGFRNLAKDAIRNEGSSSIKPWIHSVCRSGTKATLGYGETRYYSHAPFAAQQSEHGYFGQGQANANYFLIVDLGEPTEFDTIALYNFYTTYGYEYYVNNKMNSVSFEVTNDIGVESPSWTVVRAAENDIRQWAGEPALRHYTFASGSVTARYIKYKTLGGTRNNTLGYVVGHFGVYNISASCVPGTTPAFNEIKDLYGGPTSSICQIELANTKNWQVGDELYFAGKTDTTYMGRQQYKPLRDLDAVTGYQSLTGSNSRQVLGGLDPVYTIEAINGNVITLDRCPIYKLEDGMLAYKFNRGGIRLEGMDNTSMFQFHTSTSYPWTHLQNVTIRNGTMNIQGDYDNSNYFFLEDFSISNRHDNYYNYIGVGPGTFMRNVLIVGDWYGYAQLYPNTGQHSSAMYYNVVAHKTGDLNNLNGAMVKKWVSNFEHNNAVFAGWNQLYNNYTSRRGNLPDKVIRKNAFLNMRWPNEYVRPSSYPLQYSGPSSIFDRMQISNIILSPEMSEDFITIYEYTGKQGSPMYSNFMESKTKTLGVNLATRRSWINGGWSGQGYDESGLRMATRNTNTGTKMSGTFVSGKHSKILGGSDFIMFGHYYYRHYLANRNNEFQLFTSGPNYKPAGYDLCSLYCDFEVHEDTDVRFDFDCVYKLTFTQKYSVGAGGTSSQYSTRPGQQVVLLNGSREVLDTIDFTATDFETITHRKIHSLPAGVYRIETRFQNQYNQCAMYHVMSFKSIDLKLVTADLSKVTVYESNFDILTLFDKARFKQRRNTGAFLAATEAGGQSLVLKQSSDLGGTRNYKFNKIKL